MFTNSLPLSLSHFSLIFSCPEVIIKNFREKLLPISNLIWTKPPLNQCDQIGRFIGLWATFKSLWQQLICPNFPHSESKSIIFLMKSFWATFIDIWRFFWSHCSQLKIYIQCGRDESLQICQTFFKDVHERFNIATCFDPMLSNYMFSNLINDL